MPRKRELGKQDNLQPGTSKQLKEKPSHSVHAFHAEGMAVHEGLRDLLAAAANDAIKCLPGYAHALGGVNVIHVLTIRQTKGFHFIRGEDDLLKFPQRNASRFEIRSRRAVSDLARALRTRHEK